MAPNELQLKYKKREFSTAYHEKKLIVNAK